VRRRVSSPSHDRSRRPGRPPPAPGSTPPRAVTDAAGGPFVAILPVPVTVTYPLRQRVLRPHQRPDQVALPGDDEVDSAHFAAFSEGQVAGVVSLLRQPPGWAPDLARAWRLRGMATEESRRRLGIGAALLAEVVGHVRAAGGGLLWCHARTPAQSFYRRGGFRTRGDPWVDPEIGPHIAMEMTVEGPAGGTG
jgi:GNAT superfamily N-acetyltransferase